MGWGTISPRSNHLLGFTWREPLAILPRLISAMHYTRKSVALSGRISQAFWVLDYSCRNCGLTRVGTPKSAWRERLPTVAHLYPPSTVYWEDTRKVTGPMEGAWVVFAGGDEAGLRQCIPNNQVYARILDPNGLILEKLHAAAVIGTENGAAGFWEAQAIFCSILQILRQLTPAKNGEDVIFAPTTASASFVKTVDAFLSARIGHRVSLAQIAKALHVSPSTLSHRYASESGRTPLAAFKAMRLDIARSLLMQGVKLDSVALQSGFCDAYHLSKAFRHHFAMSPASFRSQARSGQCLP